MMVLLKNIRRHRTLTLINNNMMHVMHDVPTYAMCDLLFLVHRTNLTMMMHMSMRRLRYARLTVGVMRVSGRGSFGE